MRLQLTFLLLSCFFIVAQSALKCVNGEAVHYEEHLNFGKRMVLDQRDPICKSECSDQVDHCHPDYPANSQFRPANTVGPLELLRDNNGLLKNF